MSGRRCVSAFLLAAGLVVCAAAPVGAQQPARPAEKVRTGKVEVTVAVKGGGAPAGLTLYLGDQKAEVPAGKTTHLFDNVAVTRARALTGDATVGGKRFAGVEPVAITANRTTKATLTLAESGSMDDFCRRCHPESPEDAGEGQILRDRHVSGKELGEKHQGPVAKYNARVEELRKAGKAHDEPIVLEKRVVTVGGKKVERLFYTCESCHTLHWARTEQKYTRALFKKQGDLCRGCHP